MRVLLVEPEDSPRRGRWSKQRWDLIVDLGVSSAFSEAQWSDQCGCRILRSELARQGMDEAKQVREILRSVQANLIDEEGLDWWEIVSLLMAEDLFLGLAVEPIAVEIAGAAEIWATRRGRGVRMLEIRLGRRVETFGDGRLLRSIARVQHYAELRRRFSASQFQQIVLDKYDSGYRWRSRFTPSSPASPQPVVLVPSAYTNASRMSADYARLLPEQCFLMVATRQSAKAFDRPPNVEVRDLAPYARADSDPAEVSGLLQGWNEIRKISRGIPEMRLLVETGRFDLLTRHLEDGVRVRNAWREVFDREPVQAVLCGDDSNIYTRLPVMLAARRKLPTLDFHHGALDGRCLFKQLPSDFYLAKNDMERDYLIRVCGWPAPRVVIAAPSQPDRGQPSATSAGEDRTALIFFSEPYEVTGMRTEEVYREILPPLCRIARQETRKVVVKLHPFESRKQCGRLICDLLSPDDASLVDIIDGPLTEALMAKAWFGVTVQSTAVVDCLQRGICCFLCGWLRGNAYEYGQQYSRFRLGELLPSVEAIREIPDRLPHLLRRMQQQARFQVPAEPSTLRQLLRPAPHELREKSAL